ncbi:SDR family NAD(P)-dependent oxidoreductase [Pseudooceanicola sp. MF1-13]|uniref:SDR family NAD(P)-dependent oxidoreductase n=1 Tax=Pseudooceanicola sp. MF1-13 TaxID=3379095 RepID=UPI003891F981
MKKVVLVTGGARGIGRAIASDMSRDHLVAITYNTTQPDSPPPGGMAIQSDLTAPGATDRVVAQVMERFGRLDIIVNNAGLVEPTPKEEFDTATAARILDINLIAPQALLSSALPHLTPGAAVVNISSMNAWLPPRNAATYGASKAALNLWTKAMAKELGPQGIRVNAVAPGATNIPEAPRPQDLTDLFVKDVALGRIGEPEDIARAVRFLASDDASYITGEVLTVSGGYRL